ncbi:PEP/pyruvate-binding domain-containing protein [Streptomyces sp. SID13726]|uniref:PEP/pyruvate-binding domain-containing protein n=1 Tax=Streptomyces sp. SID13726 TaxID=2706058 RepID=UPI0013B89B0B|nr:PEP/pyruvate-binding domain-containing protein [Streptomyces sp. SID13726]NEB01515.1 pyruvate phosphate dikinase [Streptomyces sp. SID13726]
MTTLDERHGEGARDGEGRRGAARSDRAEAYGRISRAAVPLERPAAAAPMTAGSKAANLARAARAGLPVLPGFVIPSADGTTPQRTSTAPDQDTLHRAWRELSHDGTRPLVVRSSSPQEDTEESSLAGQFASVLDVRGWPAFRTAVRTVLDSAERPDGSTAPMAVLVQPMLKARVGGVMFGADPVGGRADRMLVSAVRGGPDSLVSGEQAGTDHWLSRRGRLLRTEGTGHAEPLLTRSELFRLARLARRARRVFGSPQDIEFGFGADGRLWLFQSRPITAMAVRPARGARLLGPGPVAETLPEQLAPLEEDLWVAPMARGLAAALDIGGSAPRRLLRTVPVVTTVGGRAAADLRLLGAVAPRHHWLALLNPAPGARRLGSAWRVGRLGAALPGLALDLVADVDARLARIPAPSTLADPDLAAELRWTRAVLVSLHAQEALAGALLPAPPDHRTAAGSALKALSEARARGVPDERVIATTPVVLALTAPSVRGPGRLPGAGNVVRDQRPGQVGQGAPGAGNAVRERPAGRDQLRGAPETETAVSLAERPAEQPTEHRTAPRSPALPPREALRLRVRWIQELQVRLVREAARRIGVEAGRLALLRWKELADVLYGDPLPGDFAERLPAAESPPLPDAFRLAEGTVVAEREDGEGGRGVSGGRAVGTVWDGTGARPSDAVLVVRTLDPALAPLLPGLTALVAQTGSPLSHLAVLAREFGLPAVVGATDAVRRFPPGSRLTVDGTTGDVRVEEASGRAGCAPVRVAGDVP